MEVKLGAHVYYIVSMTTTTTNSLRHFSLKLLLHSSNSNSPMVARIEMKPGMYAYYIISMTITCFHDDRILFAIDKALGNFLYNIFMAPQTC